jgi:hypothetical protein
MFVLPEVFIMYVMRQITIAIAGVFALVASAAAGPVWHTVANNGDTAPGGDPALLFRSYNQPGINQAGVVVFRARARAESGSQQIDGVYMRDTAHAGPITKLLARGDAVPEPNNTDYQGAPAAFTEFPSIPRIDTTSALIATRGQHQPVWTYLLGATETRVGTSGIYAFPSGKAVTGASLLGSVVDEDQVTLTFPWYSVPGAPPGTRFDQFPGSPSLTGGRYIVYKGNYTNPVTQQGCTGIYFRDVVGMAPMPYTGLIADCNRVIPGQSAGQRMKFGSTAPPSAVKGYAYFTGLDNEDAPTLGGIYRAPLASSPPLQTLVRIGGQVPGEPAGTGFRQIGEALSVSSDGRRVAFWGAWGTKMFQKTLICPTDGNADLIAYCNEVYPDGLVVDIRARQGVFVYDTLTGVTTRVAQTGAEGADDFLFWVFSGKPPGSDEGSEPARWRSSAFAAIDANLSGQTLVAFKAERNGTSGIYLRPGTTTSAALQTIVEVGTTQGTSVDPDAPAGSVVSSVGIERDGFRGGRLAATISMLYVDPIDPEITSSWGGIYTTRLLFSGRP